MDGSARVVLIAHGHLGSFASAAASPPPAVDLAAGRDGRPDPVPFAPAAVSLLATFTSLWQIFAQRADLRPVAPRGMLLTWHPTADGAEPAPRLLTLHVPGGRAQPPPVREGRAARTTWDRVAHSLPPLPSAPAVPPAHFALLYVEDGVLQPRVSASVPLMPDGRVDPSALFLPPRRWPSPQPSHLRLVPRVTSRTPGRHHMPDPFRGGWALLPSGPVPQAIVAALQDAQSGQRWTAGEDGRPVHTLRRRQSLVRTTLGAALDIPSAGSPHSPLAYLGRDCPSLDVVADVLLVLLIHAHRSGGDAAPVWATADGLLDTRCLRRVRKRDGRLVRSAGHRVEDRAAVAAAVRALAAIQVEARRQSGPGDARDLAAPLLVLHDVQERSRADGTTLQGAWRYTLGPWVGALAGGREPAALFPQRALQYDPYRRRYAKRLARYLAFHFRMDAGRGGPLDRDVGSLLKECALVADERNPERTRSALAEALVLLQADGLLAGWRIDGDGTLPARGWLPHWLRLRVQLTPASLIQARYARLRGVPESR